MTAGRKRRGTSMLSKPTAKFATTFVTCDIVTWQIPVPVQAPGRMAPAATAIALALCDFETPIWLDDALSADEAIVRYLRFHTLSNTTNNHGHLSEVCAYDTTAAPP